MEGELLGPVTLAAIDAGSNAIRLQIARAFSVGEMECLYRERAAVRLGHRVFVKKALDPATIDQAVEAFQRFRARFDAHKVERYRAVGTAAVRAAKNSDTLIDLIRAVTGIDLEVIEPEEEARLVRQACLAAIGEFARPGLIVDLGGGSLKVNLRGEDGSWRSVSVPVGTVQLGEAFETKGAVDLRRVRRLERHVRAALVRAFPAPLDLAAMPAVACGGNAEVLARIAPGAPEGGLPVMDMELLDERLWMILGVGVRQRMKSFNVRRDRAEVLGVAAIVFSVLAEWMNVPRFLVPGVGVREGILADLAADHFDPRPGSFARSGARVWSPPSPLHRARPDLKSGS